MRKYIFCFWLCLQSILLFSSNEENSLSLDSKECKDVILVSNENREYCLSRHKAKMSEVLKIAISADSESRVPLPFDNKTLESLIFCLGYLEDDCDDFLHLISTKDINSLNILSNLFKASFYLDFRSVCHFSAKKIASIFKKFESKDIIDLSIDLLLNYRLASFCDPQDLHPEFVLKIYMDSSEKQRLKFDWDFLVKQFFTEKYRRSFNFKNEVNGSNSYKIFYYSTKYPVYLESFTLRGHNAFLNHASFNENSTRIVTSSNDHTAKVWDAKTGNLKLTLQGHSKKVNTAFFSPDSSKIVTTSSDRTVKVWNSNTGVLIKTLDNFLAPVVCACFSLDGSQIITQTKSRVMRLNQIHFWNIQNWQMMKRIENFFSSIDIRNYKQSSNGRIKTLTTNYNRVYIKDGLETLRFFEGHKGFVSSAKFSHDGSRVITASADQSIKIWNSDSSFLISTLKGHKDYISSAYFSKDQSMILSSSWDKTAKVWNSMYQIYVQ